MKKTLCQLLRRSLKIYIYFYMHALSNGTKFIHFIHSETLEILFLFFEKLFFISAPFNFFVNLSALKTNSFLQILMGCTFTHANLKVVQGLKMKKLTFSIILEFFRFQKAQIYGFSYINFLEIWHTYRTNNALTVDIKFLVFRHYFQGQIQGQIMLIGVSP